jgi:hypothetical protein
MTVNGAKALAAACIGIGFAAFLRQPRPVRAVHTQITRHFSPDSQMESY